MEKLLTKPIGELNDEELLDLLDFVSDEVQRRNTLFKQGSAIDPSSIGRAVDAFAEALRSAPKK